MGLLYAQKSIRLTTITYLILISSLPAKSYGDEPTAYELLQDYNFPIGVLPKGVTGYDLDESTGKFSAYLNGSCSFSLEEVNRDGDDLEFSVGIASAGFSIDNFEVCPQCGCGLNCGNRQCQKPRPLVHFERGFVESTHSKSKS